MRTSKEMSELIEKLLNDELGPEEKREILDLVSKNERLKEEYILRQKIDRAIRKKDIIDFRRELSTLLDKKKGQLGSDVLEEPKAVYRKWIQAAAILLIIIGLGYSLSQLVSPDDVSVSEASTINDPKTEGPAMTISPNQADPYSRQTAGSLPIKQENNTVLNHSEELDEKSMLLAINFEESAYFESFIDTYRSADARVISPAPGESFRTGSEIYFQWINSQDSLLLLIYSNKEVNLFAGKFKDRLHFKEKFKPGLYYWKLETENELVYMNKFYIR